MKRLCILALSATFGLCVAACSGKGQSNQAAAKGKAKGPAAQEKKDPPAEDPKELIDDGPNKKDPDPEAADDTPEPAEEGVAAEGGDAEEGAAEGGAADPLGKRFLDPPWFRKHLFADAKNAEVKRTEADDKGRFSSQILFDLADGATPESCAKHIEEKVKEHDPNLKRLKKVDVGRVQLEGATERYTTTFVCGSAKGEMKAYVSYRWID